MEPLAEQLRPRSLNEVYGQGHLVGDQGFITKIIRGGRPLSIILWGPPGCGKTSIAHLYAESFNMRFAKLSAVFSGLADLKNLIKETEQNPLFSRGTLLFVDEIHRFNKAQQDAFLPFLENGTLILVGATTENPSFHLNNALLSRVRVLILNPLEEGAQEALLQKYEGTQGPLNLTKEARETLIALAQGDGRYLLNMLENIRVVQEGKTLDKEDIVALTERRAPLYDRDGEFHYNLISALHKSVRGSDPQAALYWFCRMIAGGEAPLFIARRIIRMASEDIGLADPEALKIAVAARESYEMLGSPEGELALAEAVVYLALAPKSNALYKAYNSALEAAKQTSHLPPPSHILNAPTQLMKELGMGKGYQYDHDTPEGFSGQNYFPLDYKEVPFYQPVERGFEREMKKRIDYFSKLKQK